MRLIILHENIYIFFSETQIQVKMNCIVFKLVIDRYWYFITDTDYLYVYVPDNRYAEPIFIYCYKVNNRVKSILHFQSS